VVVKAGLTEFYFTTKMVIETALCCVLESLVCIISTTVKHN
jgi:hypothetical protein